MINKQNLWYITLFSLIVILCVYYVAMPDSSSLNSIKSAIKEEGVVSTISESTALVALRVEADEEVLKEMENLQSVLLSETTTVDEKNNAYEELVLLNSNKGKEQDLENIILKDFGYNAFVKITGDQISIVVEASEHNNEIANKIIRRVQQEYDVSKYITIKFQ